MFVDEKKLGELPAVTPLSDEVCILREASKVLLERGWVQGTVQNANGEMCLLGALQYASAPFSSVAKHRAWALLARAIGFQMFGSRDVAHWNDTKYRTFREVLSVLRKAEELA